MDLLDDLLYEILHNLPPTDTLSFRSTNKHHYTQTTRILPKLAHRFVTDLAIYGITDHTNFYLAMTKPTKKTIHNKSGLMHKILATGNQDWIKSFFRSDPSWANPDTPEYLLAKSYYLELPVETMMPYKDKLYGTWEISWNNEILYLASVYTPDCPNISAFKEKFRMMGIKITDLDNWWLLAQNDVDNVDIDFKCSATDLFITALVTNQPTWISKIMASNRIKKPKWRLFFYRIREIGRNYKYDFEPVKELLKYDTPDNSLKDYVEKFLG